MSCMSFLDNELHSKKSGGFTCSHLWVDAVKKIYVVSDVLRTIYETLRANDIKIPFPQRDIHIMQNPQ